MKDVSRAGMPSTLLLTLFLASTVPCVAGTNAASPTATPVSPKTLHVYRSLIPLGSEVFSYSHSSERETFYIMMSASSREFNGQSLCEDGDHRMLRLSNGNRVERYPREVHFRVSVSERDGYTPLDPPMPVDYHESTFADFISSLKFEMRIFRALKARIVRPTKVTHIGVPIDVPSNERIYDVAFDLGDVPITDRIVVHVLTSDGDRLAKFNFDLF